MHFCYNLFLKNYLMINYQPTRNLLGHPDLQSWVPDWATAKKFLNHRLNGLCRIVWKCSNCTETENKTYSVRCRWVSNPFYQFGPFYWFGHLLVSMSGTVNTITTRKHSSRMHTACFCSSVVGGGSSGSYVPSRGVGLPSHPRRDMRLEIPLPSRKDMGPEIP